MARAEADESGTEVGQTTRLLVAEQAIEKMSAFANNKTFRTGKITQFVMFGSDYSDFANMFDATNITNLNDLTNSIKDVVMPLI